MDASVDFKSWVNVNRLSNNSAQAVKFSQLVLSRVYENLFVDLF